MEKHNRSLTCTCKKKNPEKHTAPKNKENKEGKEEYEQCAATQNTKGPRPPHPPTTGEEVRPQTHH